MTFVKWNATKWAMANAKLGLKYDEICPGVTLDQHAESLAMFDVHNYPYSNSDWEDMLAARTWDIKESLMSGYEE